MRPYSALCHLYIHGPVCLSSEYDYDDPLGDVLAWICSVGWQISAKT